MGSRDSDDRRIGRDEAAVCLGKDSVGRGSSRNNGGEYDSKAALMEMNSKASLRAIWLTRCKSRNENHSPEPQK